MPTAELFPSSDRCVFERAPLTQVACQLRFPPILSIEASPPAQFQDRIRHLFPLLEQTNPMLFPPLPPISLPADVTQILQGVGQLQYAFKTEDSKTTLTLSRDLISVTTTDYGRWERFSGYFREPFRAFAEIYRPSFLTRVGLRYVNVIVRATLGLSGVPLSGLFRREVMGELAIPEFESSVDGVANRTLRLRLPNNEGHCLMKHGLATIVGSPPASEMPYLIDFDLYSDTKQEMLNVEPILDSYHELAGRAFRWVITERLRAALGPMDAAASGERVRIE